MGLSCNDLGDHEDWIKDIDSLSGSHVFFPIIADPERKIANLYVRLLFFLAFSLGLIHSLYLGYARSA